MWISFCAADSPQCVEARRLENGSVEVRDGKLGDDSPVLKFDAEEWSHFESGLRSGRLEAAAV